MKKDDTCLRSSSVCRRLRNRNRRSALHLSSSSSAADIVNYVGVGIGVGVGVGVDIDFHDGSEVQNHTTEGGKSGESSLISQSNGEASKHVVQQRQAAL